MLLAEMIPNVLLLHDLPVIWHEHKYVCSRPKFMEVAVCTFVSRREIHACFAVMLYFTVYQILNIMNEHIRKQQSTSIIAQ